MVMTMAVKIRVLAINPGSTSTKIALFDDYDELFSKSINHSQDELNTYGEIINQLDYRTETVGKAMDEKGYSMEDVDVFVGRGGGLLSLTGGTYDVSELLAQHARIGTAGQHPAQLAPLIARQFADRFGKRAVVVNPPSVDEFCDVARVTGVKGVYRQSHIHALNQKEVALRFCASRGLRYDDVNLVICHLGGGISITAHEKGKMIDSNDIIKGSGPMTPTRAGDLPYIKVLDLAYSGEYTKSELTDKLNINGGVADHFGTADLLDIEKRAIAGEKYPKVIFDGMIYQNAKYVGAMAVALKGKVDAIILTGGISRGKYFTDKMKEYAGWIAEIVIMPGEFELEALAAGAVRVMRGEEELKTYTGIPVWDGFEGVS